MSMSRHLSPAAGTARIRSHPQSSRNSSIEASFRYAGGPENMVLPDGQIGEEAIESLNDLVHPHHHHESEETLTEEAGAEDYYKLAEERNKLPWYKRPSPWWFILIIAASAFAVGATMAPRIELYTRLVCDAHKPNYTIGRGAEDSVVYSLYSSTTGNSSGDRYKLCATDPEVGASVATLLTIYATCMGVLGCLTTGWWTSLSDRAGRIRVMRIVMCGILFADYNFIGVANFTKYLPGSYWWFVLGALVEGIFGSVSTTNAVIHAYVSDVVEPHERAHIFSLVYGLLFCGIAVGPTAGGLIVRFTGTPLSVFYMSAVLHTACAFLVWFVVPESLTSAQQMQSRRQYEESVAKGVREANDAPVLHRFKRIFGFLSPLSVLWSMTEANASPNPLKSRNSGWGLQLMALSYACAMLIMGSYAYKFQYTSAMFGWTSEQIGYWLSIVGLVRAVFLTIILPVIIKLFKPKSPPPVQLPTSPDEPLQSSSAQPSSAPPLASIQSVRFDLKLVRISVLIEFMSFALLPLTTNPLVFTALSILGCFGAGHAPAAQSVSLALYGHRGGVESGKLLGAFGVLQVLCSQILGPALFGMTYVKTVAKLPAAIFIVSSTIVGVSFLFLLCVRLPKPAVDVEEPTDPPPPGHSQDETLVDVDVPAIVIDAVSSRIASASASPKIPSVNT